MLFLRRSVRADLALSVWQLRDFVVREKLEVADDSKPTCFF